MKQELLKDGTDSLYLNLHDHSVPVVPSSCTIRILDGGTVLESGTATSGVYTPTSATVGEAREDVVVEWTYAVNSGPTQKKTELVDVVLFKLTSQLSDDDLASEAPGLSESDPVYRGTVGDLTGVTTGIVDEGLRGSRDDWVGAILTAADGLQAGLSWLVTGFDAEDGLVEFTAVTYPVEGDTYTLRRTHQGEIDAAWAEIYDRLIQQCSASGKTRAALVMSPDRLRRPHLMKTLEKVYRGMASDPTGVDWARAEYYKNEFEAAWTGLRLVYADQDSADPVKKFEGSGQWGFGR